ncbi:MalY/PatB family protein [Sphaerisporangium aureirubrum]|uniref:cysteine-S-conjugate beta-lyase n=1 Tax=Sphaerisporangium aureirubrum TaxID=1544736 RepID=A0ABW1NBE0_9ACTN
MVTGLAESRFDAVELSLLERRDGEKWAHAPAGVLAAWVADMDFPVLPAIRDALARRAESDLGYPAWFDDSDGGPLGEVYAARTLRRFDFAPDPTSVRMFTDINQAMAATLHVATEPGDAVLLNTPITPPFVDVIERLGRRALAVPFERTPDGWGVDLDRMEALAASPRCKVLFLVNPHNPTGHVFRPGELARLADLAHRHDLLIVSDEVHADLVYRPHRHTPIASTSEETAARTVTLTSGSKAFNLAGIRCAVAHVGPREVRVALDAQRGLLFGQVSALAVEALTVAWTQGDAWLDEVRAVLDRNRRQLTRWLPAEIGYVVPDATFLAWLDCRALDLGEDPWLFFRDRAKVLLFAGTAFGPAGAGYARLNFATSARVLRSMTERIDAAVAGEEPVPADRTEVGP